MKRRKKKRTNYSSHFYSLLIIIGIIIAFYYVYQKEMEYDKNERKAYISYMKTAWLRSPEYLKNLKRVQSAIEVAGNSMEKKKKEELYYEYHRILTGYLTETNELLKKLFNLNSPSDLETIHKDFRIFMYEIKSSEISLIKFIETENLQYMTDAKEYLLKGRKSLKKIPGYKFSVESLDIKEKGSEFDGEF